MARPPRLLRDAEVGHDGATVDIDQHVLRLDVAMRDALPVRVLQGASGLREHRPRDRNRQRTLRADQIVQRATFDVAHDEEEQIFDFMHFVDRHDRLVPPFGDLLRFAAEVLECPLGIQVRRQQQLDGNATARLQLLRQKYGGEATAAQLANNREPTGGGCAKPFNPSTPTRRRWRTDRRWDRHS